MSPPRGPSPQRRTVEKQSNRQEQGENGSTEVYLQQRAEQKEHDGQHPRSALDEKTPERPEKERDKKWHEPWIPRVPFR